MANNPYVNKVVYGSATLVDLTGTTATADKILQGYGAFGADGAWMDGTATSSSGSGAVWQDAQGYVHLSDEGDIPLQTKTVAPSETAQTVMPDNGYYALDQVNVSAISSTYVGSGITRRSSVDLTASGASVTVPSGYYSSNASKAVASGSAGTPTATKGTVSNHAISVTPSVSNTAGYISGGTKTGTAVSVSASELVSGTKSITENGTGIDVTNYASVDVDVPTGGGTTITVEPLSVTQNGTYTAPTGTAYSPVTVNVSGGGGISGVATGTLTVASDVSTTGYTKITDTTEIGFVPTKFLVYLDGLSTLDAHICMSMYINYGGTYANRFRSVYSGQDGNARGGTVLTNWGTPATGYLYYYNGDISFYTSSSYKLAAGTYTWWAMA